MFGEDSGGGVCGVEGRSSACQNRPVKVSCLHTIESRLAVKLKHPNMALSPPVLRYPPLPHYPRKGESITPCPQYLA